MEMEMEMDMETQNKKKCKVFKRRVKKKRENSRGELDHLKQN